MCATCGCSDNTATLTLEERVLARNDHLAGHNRAWLSERAILAVNLMSSPGSGKTTLLERTIHDLGPTVPISVIEGDQETSYDADRIRAAGCTRTIQLNTGSGCHLDATMLSGALEGLDPPKRSIVLIENVGNLVCPALFDLGEQCRVVIMSVPEGADKPRKYPHMFQTADLVLLNKIDLLSYVEFELDAFGQALHQVNPKTQVLQISATKGDGLADWYSWLQENRIAA